MCIRVHTCPCTCPCVCTHGGTRSLSGVFIYHSLHYFLGYILPLNLQPSVSVRLASLRALGSAVSTSIRVLGLQMHTSTPGCTIRCWGSKPSFLCVRQMLSPQIYFLSLVLMALKRTLYIKKTTNARILYLEVIISF